MPPVLGPWSPSKARLWSCAVASGSAVSPSTSAKKLASSPSRNSSMTTSVPAAPNAPPKQSSMASSASSRVCGDDHALAGGEPVGLDDDGQALRGHISLGRGRVVEAAIGGGGDAVFGAEILGEALGAFELRRGPRRPEHLDAGRFEIVGEPGHQRRLGPDHHQVDVVLPAEADHRRMVGHVERHAVGDRGDPGIARRAIEPVEQGALPELPGERMLAAARLRSAAHSPSSAPLVRSPGVCSGPHGEPCIASG